MRGLMRRSVVLAGAVAVMLGSGMGIADASPPRPVSGAPAWSIMPTPNPRGGTDSGLGGVSCRSASACTAVGAYVNNATNVTLAERWNGKAWAIQPTPNPSGSTDTQLGAVSCPSASACTAVGFHLNNGGTANVMLAERWNGKAWAIQPTPPTIIGLAVSCPSASACTAVGGGPTGRLAERWNGKAWTVQHTPNPEPGGTGVSAVLDGVSCTLASACTAVGFYRIGGVISQRTLAERWNGTTWTIQPTPSFSDYSSLDGVSCTSASACTAVGQYESVSGDFGTLAERWNGTTWTIQSTPSEPFQQATALNGVSCPSASACTAVGYFTGTLAERWNGTTWAIQPTPGRYGSSLNGVSCTSASACIAVGSGTRGTLVERYGPSS
jgi:hypothetical protein